MSSRWFSGVGLSWNLCFKDGKPRKRQQKRGKSWVVHDGPLHQNPLKTTKDHRGTDSIHREYLTTSDAGDGHNNRRLLVAHIHSLHFAASENIQASRTVRGGQKRPSESPPPRDDHGGRRENGRRVSECSPRHPAVSASRPSSERRGRGWSW